MANKERSKNFLNIYQGYYQNYSLVYGREEARRRAIIDSLQVMGYDRDTAERVYDRWRRRGSSTIGGKLLDIAEKV